jgi:hypothetical protein
LYWSLSAVGWRTETQWNRLDKRNALEKLKIHTNYLFEAVKVKGNLGVQGRDKILKTT